MFKIPFVTVKGPKRRCWSFWHLDKSWRWFSYKTFWPMSRWCPKLNLLRYACDRAVCLRHLSNVAENFAWSLVRVPKALAKIAVYEVYPIFDFSYCSQYESVKAGPCRIPSNSVFGFPGRDQVSMTLVFVVLSQRLSRKESSQLCSSH